MKFKSQVYTAASGSIGGVTFSRNKGGMYTRARAIPTNPNSTRQVVMRQSLSQLAVAWNLLSVAERDAWNLYAANVPMTDRLGESFFLSGQQHFIRSNCPRLQAGLAIVEAAPTTFNLGNLGTILLAGADISNAVTIGWAGGDEWDSVVGSALIVYTGRPQNPGVSYFKGPFRFAGIVPGALAPPTSPVDIDNSESGFVLTLGQNVWAKVSLSQADGRLTNPTIVGPYVVDGGGA